MSTALVVGVIGGQGSLLGRGNQQLSSRVVRTIGFEYVLVVASLAKIGRLAGLALSIDWEDAMGDDWIPRYVWVVAGAGHEVVYPVRSRRRCGVTARRDSAAFPGRSRERFPGRPLERRITVLSMGDGRSSAVDDQALLRGALDIAHALQEVGSTRELQSTYLAEIQNHVDADGYGIYLLDPANLQPVDMAATVPEVFLQRYEAEGRRDDPVLAEAVVSRRPVDSSRLSDGRSWQDSAVLAVLEQAGFYHSLEAPVVVGGQVQGSLAMVRRRHAAPFSERDLTVMGLVADQVGAVLVRARRYESVGREVMLLTDVLHAMSQPIVITTLEGGLIFRNDMATRPAPGSSVSYLERARPVLGEALRELRCGTQRIVTTRERPAGSGVRGAEPRSEAGTGSMTDSEFSSRSSSKTVRHGTVGDHGRDPGVVVVKAVRLQSCHEAVVAFLSHRARSTEAIAGGAVHLSPREQEIVDLVRQGLTNQQIARRVYVSENTVKQYLKRIFSKLEVHSRVELVQVLWETSSCDPERHPSGR